MRTIAIVNQKGGCGKTTTAINLAAVFAQRGYRTLLVDFDPQSHCAAGLGVPEEQIESSIAEALLARHDSSFDRESLTWEVGRNFDLIPSTMRLAALEAPGGGLHQLADKDRRLASLLRLFAGKYEYCLIDCPPTIGLLTFNALRAAREALVPVETGYFAMKGAHKQWSTIQKTIQHIGRPIACHLLPTLHRSDLRTAQEILAALRRDFAGQILPVVIRDHDELRTAAGFGQPVVEYAPNSGAYEDFHRLADWLEAHSPEGHMQIEVMPAAQQVGDAATAAPASAHGGATRAPAPPAGPGGGSRGPADAGSSRAAELAARVRGLGPRAAEPRRQAEPAATEAPPAPGVSDSARTAAAAAAFLATPRPLPALPAAVAAAEEPPRPLVEEIRGESEVPPAAQRIAHLFGVRRTTQGILFVQPGPAGRRIAVAGDFNGWSPSSHPMTYNAQLDVHQTIVPLPPGVYRYRMVVDGRWEADQYNPRRDCNCYGESNSVLTVEPA